jgi:hypothetical protein
VDQLERVNSASNSTPTTIWLYQKVHPGAVGEFVLFFFGLRVTANAVGQWRRRYLSAAYKKVPKKYPEKYPQFSRK